MAAYQFHEVEIPFLKGHLQKESRVQEGKNLPENHRPEIPKSIKAVPREPESGLHGAFLLPSRQKGNRLPEIHVQIHVPCSKNPDPVEETPGISLRMHF